MSIKSAQRSAWLRAPCVARTLAAVAALACASAGAQSVPQFGVTAVNATGNALYNLPLTPSAAPSNGATITTTQVLNTDASQHKNFFAVARVPNSFTSALDYIVADATNGQIVRYPGPGPASYATATPIFTWSGAGSGPKYPIGVAADVIGNVYVISAAVLFDAKPALWVLPFNAATGNYGAPVLIDNTCGLISEVLVAQTAATPVGSAAPAWNVGDVLVLEGNLLSPRVVVYSQAAVAGVIATGTPLNTQTSIAVPTSALKGTLPVGMDIWPADATHGVSLLITTALTGRVMRFDTAQGALTADFSSGLGAGLGRIKVGTYSTLTYAFAEQFVPGRGKILQFGAPPASGPNSVLASVSVGTNDPQGLAVTSSGSVPVNTCVAPSSCAPLGSQLTTQISGPGAASIPPNAPLLEESCVVQTDPRVTVSQSGWSCSGATLDVAQFCPGFPSTILPGTMCGHSGPSGSGFIVVKSTAKTIDQNVNNTFIQNVVDPNVPLPGPQNLNCPQVQVFAWAPRSDLYAIEGSIVENPVPPGSSSNFIDLTSFCDKGGGTTHSLSMFAYGLGLNSAQSGFGNDVPGFVNTKFNNLAATISAAGAQINGGVAQTLQAYIAQAQAQFNSGVNETASNGYSCSMNSIATADAYMRANLTGNFSYAAPPGNINPAGEIDGRLGNLFLTIDTQFLMQPPNTEWPTTNVPPCVTLTAAPTTVTTGPNSPGSTTLTWGPATTGLPLSFTPQQCTLSANDGTFLTPATEPGAGSASSGPLTVTSAPYAPQLTCSAAQGNTITSLTATTVTVIQLTSISVTPASPQVPAGQTTQLAATGTYSSGPTQDLTGTAAWASSAPAVATVSAGLVACNPNATGAGTATISATSSGITGSTTVSCQAPVIASVVVTPNKPSTVPVSGSLQLTATANYASGQTLNVTTLAAWSSSDTSVATVSSSGVVKCQSPHWASDRTATISATYASSTGTTTVTCSCGKSPPPPPPWWWW